MRSFIFINRKADLHFNKSKPNKNGLTQQPETTNEGGWFFE
jgi:hypothetical protein